MKLTIKKNIILLIFILITFFIFLDNASALTSKITYPLSGSTIEYKTKGVNKTRYFKYFGVYSTSDRITFCLEPGVPFTAGSNFVKKTYDEYKTLRGSAAFNLSATQKDLLAKISTLSKKSNDVEKLATQALYWEIITGERTKFTECASGNCKPDNKVSGSLYETLSNNSGLQTAEGEKIRGIIKAYDKIVNDVYLVFTKNPGSVFKIDSSAKNDSPQVLKYDKKSKKWSKTIYDTDSAFSYWKVVDDYPDYITVEKKDNAITISSSKEMEESVAIKIKTNRNSSAALGSFDVYINNSNKTSQALFEVGETEIIKNVYVTTEKSTYGLKITKKDEATENHLSGATFELCADSECNEVIATDNTWSVLATRPATFLVDQIGTYYYREIEAPEGYILNDEIYEVELTYDNAYDGFDSDLLNLFGTPKEVTVYNTKKATTTESTTSSKTTTKTTYYQLKIKKIDSVTKDALSGVQFRICSDSNCKNIIASKTTDNKGEIVYDGLTKPGVYYVKEYKTLDGYIFDDVSKEIYVTSEDIKGSSNYAEITIENTKKTYGFNLTKNTMDENGNVTKLEDGCNSSDKSATFTIKNARGEDLFFEKIEEGMFKPALSTQEGVTKEIKTCNGAFSVEKLTECEYTITETKAPAGVTLPSNPSKKVNVCGSDKNISFTNGFTGLEFQKKDEDGVFISGGKFVLEQYTKSGWVNKKVTQKQGEQGVYTYSEAEGEFLFETNEGIAYISGLPAGKYRIVEKEAPADYELIEVSDVPEITISDEQKDGYYILTLINRKINKYGSDASAELVITITTGRKVLNYVLIVSSLAALLVIAIIIRKRIKK